MQRIRLSVGPSKLQFRVDCSVNIHQNGISLKLRQTNSPLFHQRPSARVKKTMPRSKAAPNQSSQSDNNGEEQEQLFTRQQLQGLLDEQKGHFKELLENQAKNFTSFLETFMNSTNRRIDEFIANVSGELVDIKRSLEFTQNEIDENKDVKNYDRRITEIEEKCDSLENHSRRNNIRIEGMPEETNETWSQTEEKVGILLAEQLGVQSVQIDRAHRTGPKSHARKPQRSVLVRLTHYKDKEVILNKAKEKRLQGIYFNEDFSQKIMAKRQALLPKMWEARQAGKIAFLKHDKLIIKDRTSAGDEQ